MNETPRGWLTPGTSARSSTLFGPEGAYIEDGVTKDHFWLHEQTGMYMAKMWIPKSPSDAGF